MSIYTSFLTAGLLVASPVPTNFAGSSQTLNAPSSAETHAPLSLETHAYNDDGDYLHRGSGR